MKVFWEDSFGNTPPGDAIFSYCPFNRVKPVPFGKITRVQNLPEPQHYKVRSRSFSPSKEEWIQLIKKTKSEMIPKVVLARCCSLECEEAPDPFAVLASLKKKGNKGTLFCLSDEKKSFLGATPEMLFSRNKNTIELEAVAGTGLITDDQQEFLNSKKDLSEIEPVITYLIDNLSPICESPPHFGKIGIKQTPNLIHLHSKGKATLKVETDREVIEKIHPTPALCGLPKKKAMDWIEKHEPFQRGLYGGTLGWSTQNESSWIVAIRCCEIENKTVKLYTGVGIVPLSDPINEWEELNSKMALFEDIFESNLDH